MKRKLLFRRSLSPDKQLRVEQITVGARTFIDIREFVPSLDRYGRGILLDAESFLWLIDEIGPVILEQRWPKGLPGPGQGKML